MGNVEGKEWECVTVRYNLTIISSSARFRMLMRHCAVSAVVSEIELGTWDAVTPLWHFANKWYQKLQSLRIHWIYGVWLYKKSGGPPLCIYKIWNWSRVKSVSSCCTKNRRVDEDWIAVNKWATDSSHSVYSFTSYCTSQRVVVVRVPELAYELAVNLTFSTFST